MRRSAVATVSAVLLVATSALAAPGDPFGGDDTGCVPADALQHKCESSAVKAIAKLTFAVIKCHLVQAEHAFKHGSGTTGFSNAEENCEKGPSSTSAKAKFDNRMQKLTELGCDPQLVANGNARRDLLLADETEPASLHALNGRIFCDATSGEPIDPGGDDAGFIPANDGNRKCAFVTAKALGKLVAAVVKCHTSAARYGLKGYPFDEEACEEDPLKGAHTKYNLRVQKVLDAGICPSCLADSMSANFVKTMGDETVAQVDAYNGEFFICEPPPATPTPEPTSTP